MIKKGEIKKVRADALRINRKNIYYKTIQEQKDLLLKQQIEDTHKIHPSYGHKRLGMHLRIHPKRILRVMKKFDIKPPRRKVKKHYCTKSISHRKYPNLIKGYVPSEAHDLWCSDVSFFKFQGKFWYLVTIIDVVTRQIVGCHVGKKHDSNLVLQAIKEAIMNTKQVPKVFHTDQGTEFMTKNCTEYLESLGVKISASDKASPWQNGYQESFFGKFKQEIGDINRFETIGELIEEIYHHIHYYNSERIHTKLKMPPAVYAQKLVENCLKKMGT